MQYVVSSKSTISKAYATGVRFPVHIPFYYVIRFPFGFDLFRDAGAGDNVVLDS
jgi:hypothetical protein